MSGVRGASTDTHVIENDEEKKTYEEIMGIPPTGDVGGGATALSKRLVAFREWLANDAKVTAHPSLCIVNGEATDGTKNAPVLLFGPPPEVVRKNLAVNKVGRCGMVDKTEDQALYDRTMGCQVRAAREIKKDEVLMTVPRTAMITPDVIAASSAGRAVLACCQPSPFTEAVEFWDVFENTTICEKKYSAGISRSIGTQMLVNILRDRKKAEAAFNKVHAKLEEPINGESSQIFELAAPGTISTRAPVLAFLIQQRFSNKANPPVATEGNAGLDDLSSDSALAVARRLKLSPETPETFGPYARTLPSSVAVPICWKRNELALLSGSILGTSTLQDVASRTALLANEFIALVKAGLLDRFPDIFPPGMITWERWVWAAAVFDSRVFPVSCYLDEGEDSAVSDFEGSHSSIQSSPEVWDELGVMIPLQDMINHESEAPQVTWQPNVSKKDSSTGESEDHDSSHPPRAIVHKRVKKGSQLYSTYGLQNNQYYITQYGFALIGNKEDDVKFGWLLADAVGNVPPPSDYSPLTIEEKKETSETSGDASTIPKLKEADMVYENPETDPINAWWTKDRLALLEKGALLNRQVVDSLMSGKKLTACAYGDGSYHPTFLTAAVIGTMPPLDVKRCLSEVRDTNSEGDEKVLSLSKSHQEVLRNYLQFFFCRKMEKLLQNLQNGLKDHFGVQLWTKVSRGGLQYNAEEDAEVDGATHEGWQTFFDSNAYVTSMECENRYYAIDSDSCVLALYDGHVRALQASIDGTLSQEAFENGALKVLKDLGFVLLDNDVEFEDAAEANGAASSENVDSVKPKEAPVPAEQKEQQSSETGKEPGKEAGKSGSKSSRRRNRRRNGGGGGDRPPAIKLHIGNLAYTTQLQDLFKYFAELYGRDNILECHIPMEQGSGRSRGFGFVTLPDVVAMRILQSGRKHVINGRQVKVAESNSTGGRSRGSGGPASATSDRCATCGYGPRYCECQGPNSIPRYEIGSWHHYGDAGRPPPDYPDPYYGERGRDDRRRRSYSRSPSYHRSGSRGRRSRDRDYDRDYYERDYDRDPYGRDPYRDHGSRSYSRGGDRASDRGRRDPDRSRERSRDRSRGRSRRSRSPGRPRSREGRRRSRSVDRSRSRSGERSSRRDRNADEGDIRTPPPGVPSPNALRASGSGGGSERKRDGGKRSRSRSRSRGRSGKRRKSSKKEGSRRHRSRSRSRSKSGSPRATDA